MINILQTEEKKKIISEYHFRLGIVSMLALSALIFSSLVMLAPSYFLAVSKYNNAKSELAVLESKQNNNMHGKNTNTEIVGINKKIDLFLKGVEKESPSPAHIILNILNIKSGAIKIQGFMYDASGEHERCVITGTAIDRDSLAQFVESLKKESTFAKVDIPISSYVKSNNIDFSIAIEHGSKK